MEEDAWDKWEEAKEAIDYAWKKHNKQIAELKEARNRKLEYGRSQNPLYRNKSPYNYEKWKKKYGDPIYVCKHGEIVRMKKVNKRLIIQCFAIEPL